MFYHDKKLQYKVWIEKPNPNFAKMLQQAIGGIEGEMRVCLQYLFQAWGSRGPKKYKDMLLETGTEEISHIEMLATAVALNLEGAPVSLKEQVSQENPIVEAVMGGGNPRHILSSGLGAMAVDSSGVPFSGSWITATGNLAADMQANIMAESTGRLLVSRLHEMTDDKGMKDMLSFLLARDTMHQNQWLAVLEELGDVYPIPNSKPQSDENQDFNYSFISTDINKPAPGKDRWVSGKSIDGKGTFKYEHARPYGEEPNLGKPKPETYAQKEQMNGQSLVDKVVDKVKK